MANNVYPVLMAGGASSRLWPISDTLRPKWELRLFGDKSLLEGAWERGRLVAPAENGLVVAGGAHKNLIRRSLPDLPESNLLIEPDLRDTAGAVAYAAGHVLRSDPNGVLLILPGDHLIADLKSFEACARTAIAMGVQESAFVTFGVVPTYPATCYGYVHRGDAVEVAGSEKDASKSYRMLGFREKPGPETAETYVESGEYYWNAGIFVFPLPVLMEEFEANLPGHAKMVKELAAAEDDASWGEVARSHYPELERISIDFGIMEHAKRTCTVAADFDWDDIGSWTAVRANLPKEGENAVGPGVQLDAIDAEENVVFAPGRRVAVIGLREIAVVDDAEGLLVCNLDDDQSVKAVSQKKPALRCLDVSAPSQDRAIDVALVEPENVGPETGFMLVIHGYGNSRRQYAKAMERWAERYNVVCVSPEYRDSGLDADPEKGRGAREPYDFSHLQLVDCLNAFLLARRRHPHADVRRAYVWGGSQGGHIASLIAGMAPKTFALCINSCGISHLEPRHWEGTEHPFTPPERDIRDALRWVDRIKCPVVLMHGVADPTVGEAHTRDLAAALAAAGKDFSVRFIPDGDHFLRPVTTRERVTEEMADDLLKSCRRDGPDDFEAKSRYEFPCSDGVTFHLDFSSGIAQFSRSP